jgi:hypothetical protein
MVFKVQIAEHVKETILSELINRIKYNNRSEQAQAEHFADNINNTIQNIFLSLKTNPYYYPEFIAGVRIVIEIYLPFRLFYKIVDDVVLVVDCKRKEELLNS